MGGTLRHADGGQRGGGVDQRLGAGQRLQGRAPLTWGGARANPGGVRGRSGPQGRLARAVGSTGGDGRRHLTHPRVRAPSAALMLLTRRHRDGPRPTRQGASSAAPAACVRALSGRSTASDIGLLAGAASRRFVSRKREARPMQATASSCGLTRALKAAWVMGGAGTTLTLWPREAVVRSGRRPPRCCTPLGRKREVKDSSATEAAVLRGGRRAAQHRIVALGTGVDEVARAREVAGEPCSKHGRGLRERL